MGMVTMYRLWLVGVVVRRYIDILIIINNFPYSTCIRSFLAAVYIYTSSNIMLILQKLLVMNIHKDQLTFV